MNGPPTPDPADEVARWRATARTAVASLRTCGTALLLVGGVIAFGVAVSGAPHPVKVLTGGTAALMLIAPELLYHAAAVLIRYRDVGVATVAQWTAIGQSGVSLVAIAVAVVSDARQNAGWNDLGAAILPAAVGAFFAPALLVQAWQIAVTLRRLRQSTVAQHGFEVRAVPITDRSPQTNRPADL